jgi:hypothetical protein
MRKDADTAKPRVTGKARGACLCGAVEIEFDMPAFWAWHDHSKRTQRAQGCAYATYIGVWKSRMRIAKGEGAITRYTDEVTRAVRGFCSRCGTPVFYERRAKMVNIPRALFEGRTGREPRYHRYLEESPDWAYRQEPLGPLKDYPGVLIERPRRKRLPNF